MLRTYLWLWGRSTWRLLRRCCGLPLLSEKLLLSETAGDDRDSALQLALLLQTLGFCSQNISLRQRFIMSY